MFTLSVWCQSCRAYVSTGAAGWQSSKFSVCTDEGVGESRLGGCVSSVFDCYLLIRLITVCLCEAFTRSETLRCAKSVCVSPTHELCFSQRLAQCLSQAQTMPYTCVFESAAVLLNCLPLLQLSSGVIYNSRTWAYLGVQTHKYTHTHTHTY